MRTQNLPKADYTLELASGRRLAWAEWGNRAGPPVLLLHRTPGSRLFDPDPEATEALGVWLITFDRPGYGGTDPVTLASRSEVASDAAALVRHLRLTQVAVVGWSAGGHFAVEVAARLGPRARSLSLLCTPAPDEEVRWLSDEQRALAAQVRANPNAALPAVLSALGAAPPAPAAMARADPTEADARIRALSGVEESLTAMMSEGLRQGAAGMAFDVVAGSRGDRLRLAEVRSPVHLWYGAADVIGTEHGRWFAERLSGADLTVVPDAGHLLPLLQWRQILEAALGGYPV
ncbi:MAG: alpha/beta fold hydrolase [Myxococcales bacterium]